VLDGVIIYDNGLCRCSIVFATFLNPPFLSQFPDDVGRIVGLCASGMQSRECDDNGVQQIW
jgi:hypothetical protein